MSTVAAREILVAGAGALARADGLSPTLQLVLDSIAEQLEIGSAAIFVMNQRVGRLEVVASSGLDDDTVAGLVAAIANPAHPVARTMSDSEPSFDRMPTAPGGPALRSHLPLIVTRDATDTVLGVLALAHDRPADTETRVLLQAGADLAAAAIACRGRD